MAMASDVVNEVRIELLGGFRIWIGSRQIHDSEWYLRKAKNLVKLLALAPNLSLHRGQLTELLWPELHDAAATNNLHKALHIARRVLEPDLPAKVSSSYLHMNGDFVYLQSPGPLRVDVREFLLAAQRAELFNDVATYRHAIGLYTGELLPEDRYEDWASRQREELKHTHLNLLLALAQLLERTGDLEHAVELLRQVVSIDRAHEEAHTTLMRLLALSGGRQQALRHYRVLRDALREELDAEPRASTQQLYEQILRDDAQLLVPVSPRESHAVVSLSRPATSRLVGREAEIAQGLEALNRLKQGRGTILLIAGDAGSGKSRIATELETIAAAGDMITLWGAAYSQWTAEPFSPFRVALEGFALRVHPAALNQLAGPLAPALGTLSTTIRMASHSDNGHMPSSDEVTGALLSFITRLTEVGPVVIVLEDVHAADTASLHVVERLAAIVEGLPILVVATARSSEMSVDAFQRISQNAEILRLNPLGTDDLVKLTEQVLGGEVDPALVDVVRRLADGNPYYAEEVAHALRGRNRIQQINGVWHLREHVVIAWDRDDLRHLRGASGDVRIARKLRSPSLRSSTQ